MMLQLQWPCPWIILLSAVELYCVKTINNIQYKHKYKPPTSIAPNTAYPLSSINVVYPGACTCVLCCITQDTGPHCSFVFVGAEAGPGLPGRFYGMSRGFGDFRALSFAFYSRAICCLCHLFSHCAPVHCALCTATRNTVTAKSFRISVAHIIDRPLYSDVLHNWSGRKPTRARSV